MFEGTDRESHHVKHRPACLLIMLSHPLKVILEFVQYCSVPMGMLFSLARSADLLSER